MAADATPTPISFAATLTNPANRAAPGCDNRVECALYRKAVLELGGKREPLAKAKSLLMI
ncbi:MAG: hypothetical protein PWR31_664 [Bacillota bacterium]|nr:hypothetical protein [Bacillota bacterium]